MTRRTWVFALAAYFALGVASTIVLFLQPGIVGHNWDWAVTWNAQGTTAWAQAAFSAWWTAELGTPNLGVSNAPYFYFAAMFADHPWFFSRVLLLAAPVAGSLAGMFLASRVGAAIGVSSPLGFWIGGLAFGFSPLFFNELQGGAVTQVFAHSAFALSLGLLVWYRQERRPVLLVGACVCSVLIALSLTDLVLYFPVSLLILWGVPARTYLGFVVMTIALSSYWLMPFVFSASTVLGGLGFHAFGGNLRERVPQPWQLFTFAGYAYGFFDGARPILAKGAAFATLCLVFTCFAAIARARLSRRIFRFYLLLFVGIGVAAVAAGPFAPVMLWAYDHIPGFTLFRSPQHFLIAQMLALCVVLGIGCAALLSSAHSRVVTAAVIVAAVVGRAPFLTGDYSGRYLTQQRPGNSIQTFEPSPGYVQAIAGIERQAPPYARPLFIPLTFSPLFLQTPYQGLAQGGDPASMQLAGMRGTVLDMVQALPPFGVTLENQLVDRMPEVLDSGLPAILDVSHVVVRYDMVANFVPFKNDPYVAYNVAHFLDGQAPFWKRNMSKDFVDLYQESAPAHVFLGGVPELAAGDAGDVADVELSSRTADVAFSGTAPASDVHSVKYAFESIWDSTIDRAGSDQSLWPVGQSMKLSVPRDDDYTLLVKRDADSELAGMGVALDDLPLDHVIQWSKLRAAELRGTRWLEMGRLHLAAGSHVITFSEPPLGVAAAALIPSRAVPTVPDYAYPSAPVIGVRGPSPTESSARMFRLASPAKMRIFGLAHEELANRALPIESIVGTSQAYAQTFPYFYADDVEQAKEAFVPPYWYIESALPRTFPKVALLPIFQPINFTVSTAGLGHVQFHAGLVALNQERLAEVKTQTASLHTRLPVTLDRPTSSLEAAIELSRRPTEVSVPLETQAAGESVTLALSPGVTVLGLDRGLPIGELGPTWLDLGHRVLNLRLPDKIRAQGLASQPFGSSITPVPVRNAQRIELILRPAGPIPGMIAPHANVYVQCNGGLRAYIVPAEFLPGEDRSILDLRLETLRGAPDSRSCSVVGFGSVLVTSSFVGMPDFGILGADVYAWNTWVDSSPPVALDAIGGGAYRLSGRPTQRYLSLGFPHGDTPNFYVTAGGVPAGDSFKLGHWTLEPERSKKLDGFTVFSTPLAGVLGEVVPKNEGRTVLRIGHLNILRKEFTQGLEPYWYEEDSLLYLVWPSAGHALGPGTLYVIRAEWFNIGLAHDEIILDLSPGFARALPSDVVLHTYVPTVDPLLVRYARLSAGPRSTFRLQIDRDTLNFATSEAAEWSYERTNTITRSFRAGLHTVVFPQEASLERLFLQRVPQPKPEDIVPVTELQVKSLDKWTFTAPSRSRPSTLVFLESFSPHWQLRGVDAAKHFVIDGYANGWVLPPGPSRELTLYFDGRDWLRLGCVVASTSFVVFSAWALLGLRRKKNV